MYLHPPDMYPRHVQSYRNADQYSHNPEYHIYDSMGKQRLDSDRLPRHQDPVDNPICS